MWGHQNPGGEGKFYETAGSSTPVLHNFYHEGTLDFPKSFLYLLR